MPFSGGLFDQPAKFVESMNLIHNLISENEQVTAKKQQQATRKFSGR